ncbi:MAG: hypothetical protein RLZZ450_7004 [Pseudomonadota bacterium]|jgi:integrase
MRQKGASTRFPGVQSLGDGTYRLRAKVNNPKTGRTKEIDQIKAAASALEASHIRAQLICDARSEETQQERQRLATFSLSWIKSKKRTLKASTFVRYTRTLAHHVIPQLGEFYVDAITHHDIVRWRDAQDDAKPSTVNARLRVLKTLLADATVHLNLDRDPSGRVPGVREHKVDEDDNANCLTPTQLRALLDAMSKSAPRWYPLLALLAFTGMRIGEATALRWCDIDTVTSAIRVRRSIDRGQVDTTKTNAKRRAPLSPTLAAILNDHRRRLDYEGLPTAGDAWLFPSQVAFHKGKPMHKKALRKPLLVALEAAGLEGHLTTHGLRRTFNDLMRQVSSGEVVRSIMGHVTERMTEHYSHVRSEEKADAVARIVRLVHLSAKVGTQVGTKGRNEKRPAEDFL